MQRQSSKSVRSSWVPGNRVVVRTSSADFPGYLRFAIWTLEAIAVRLGSVALDGGVTADIVDGDSLAVEVEAERARGGATGFHPTFEPATA